MEKAFRTAQVGAGVVLAAGIFSDFFLYDGKRFFWLSSADSFDRLLSLVDAGSRAVIFDKVQGIQQKVVGEGTHFKIPFVQVRILYLLPVFSA